MHFPQRSRDEDRQATQLRSTVIAASERMDFHRPLATFMRSSLILARHSVFGYRLVTILPLHHSRQLLRHLHRHMGAARSLEAQRSAHGRPILNHFDLRCLRHLIGTNLRLDYRKTAATGGSFDLGPKRRLARRLHHHSAAKIDCYGILP